MLIVLQHTGSGQQGSCEHCRIRCNGRGQNDAGLEEPAARNPPKVEAAIPSAQGQEQVCVEGMA